MHTQKFDKCLLQLKLQSLHRIGCYRCEKIQNWKYRKIGGKMETERSILYNKEKDTLQNKVNNS